MFRVQSVRPPPTMPTFRMGAQVQVLAAALLMQPASHREAPGRPRTRASAARSSAARAIEGVNQHWKMSLSLHAPTLCQPTTKSTHQSLKTKN